MLLFPVSEFKERLRKTKERMAESNIDVLLVTDPANMNYLIGYNAWSFYVHQIMIVSLEKDEPIWIGRGMDAAACEHTSWISKDNILAYSDNYVQSTERHPMDFVADILKEHHLDKKTIAAEYDAYYFTAQNYIKLTSGLPNATFVDGTSLVNWVRIIKSDGEIELIKKAGQLVTNAMHKGIEMIDAGVRECDVVAEIYHTQISGTKEFGGDYTAIVPLLPAGEESNACHMTWTDDRYKDGEPVILELAGCHNRYHSPLARTVQIGKPTSDMEKVADAAIEGIQAALDVVKPGATCEEVEKAWRESIKKRGFEKESRIGYSTGLNYPPDWGEHTASIRPGDKTVLEPNMVFHMIPGLWLDNFGFELSETFRVTETGYELMANVEHKLFLK